MASAISANKAELLAIANSVASEKMIDKAIVIEAMEEAIQKSARNRYGAENDIRAKLDRRKLAKDDPALDYPKIKDGIRGMAFIEAVVKSSKNNARWTKLG